MRYVHKRLIALAFLFPYFGTLQAETIDSDDVVVTATRFDAASRNAPGQIVVITQEDIDTTPAANFPDLLSGVTGVDVFPLYGALGIDASVSLRGAGTAGTLASNTLILLNGQRLNPIDAGSIDWSLVPVSSIERIEIMPGSGTVQFGDRASGGVINIITSKRDTKRQVSASVGSHGYREASVLYSASTDDIGFNAYAQYGNDDGWRENSNQRRDAFGGRLSAGQGTMRQVFLDFAVFDEELGTPGGLWRAEYKSSPGRSRHPDDASERTGYRIRPGFHFAINEAVTLDGDLSWSQDEREGYSDASNPVEQTRTLDRDFLSFSPRINVKHQLAAIPGNTTLGIDWFKGSTDSLTRPAGFESYEQQAVQESLSLYLVNVSELTGSLAVSLGIRAQNMKQDAQQSAYTTYYGAPQVAVSGSSSQTRTAYDAGLTYNSGDWRFYGKVGTTFRFPNTDELYGLDPVTWDPVFAADLKPQHGRTYEIGTSRKLPGGQISLSLYQHDLHDEISSNPNGGNMNIERTRRRGLEISTSADILNNLSASLGYSLESAEVRAGPYAGSDLPLVPKNKANAMLTWRAAPKVDYTLRVNHVGKRSYGDDYDNVAGNLSGYTTLDLLARWRAGAWQVEAKVLNAGNKEYAAYGGYGFNTDTFLMDTFYYPAQGRAFSLTAQCHFD